MSEAINSENKEKQFNANDLVPFEHMMIGSSASIIVNGEKRSVNTKLFEEMQKDPEALRIILTPRNLAEGRKTLTEILQARNQKKILSGLSLSFFEYELKDEYLYENILFDFKLGDLDKNGQLKNFGVGLSQNGQKIAMPEKASEEIVVKEVFKNLIKYTENTDGVMQYQINAGQV